MFFVLAPLRKVLAVLICLALMALSAGTALADQVQDLSAQLRGKIQLTAQEQQWISENPVVRVGADHTYAPYSFRDPDGHYIGLAHDYLRIIAEHTGLSFEITPDLSWAQIIDNAKSQKIDVIVTATPRPERMAYLDFSEHYFPTPLVIMTTQAKRHSVSKPSDLTKQRVALVSKYAASERVLNEVPGVEAYWVDSPLEALQAVALGRADAYVGVLGVNAYLAQEQGLANIVVASYYDLQGSRQHFGLVKGTGMLKSIVDKVLSIAKPYIEQPLNARWIPLTSELDNKQEPSLSLSSSEQSYLQTQGRLHFCSVIKQAPYAALNNSGDYEGVFADFVDLMQQRLDIELAHRAADDYAQAQRMLEQGLCHFMIYIDSQLVESEQLLLTEPLVDIPLVFVTRQDIPFINGYQDLEGQSLAQVEGFALTALPTGIKQASFTTALAMLEDVNAGTSYAGMGLLHQMAWLIREQHLLGLKISGKSDELLGLRFAVSGAHQALYPVLQKARLSISEQDKQQVMQRWLNVTVEEQGLPLNLLLQIGLVVLLLGLFLLYRQRVMAKHNQLLSQANHELEQAYQDQETLIRMVSHEYRTPLAVMNSGLNLLRKESSPADEKMDRRLDMMQRASQRLRDTIDMTRQYDRWKLGRQQRSNDSGVSSLVECLDESIALQADSYPARQIEVNGWQSSEGVDDYTLAISKHDLVCCLDNLIGNALKYSENKPVQVEVFSVLAGQQEADAEFVSEPRARDFLAIAVIDEGIGIADDIQAKVFDKFYRAHNVESKTGAGLGLHIVSMLTSKYGGRVKLTSNVGKGSCFVLELPLAQD